ncbi:MAG: flagellar basal body P-ring protein FlgI, partial [Spirochaetales bacterium]|nr:flagellar basal body P-ring protein FlgI [Spirochaetales bacterium]
MKNIWQTSLPVAMRKGIVGLLIGLISFQVYAQAVPTPAPSWQVPIKDLVHVEGLRDNQLTGLGLVTGLNGQGDSASNPMLKYALASLVNNLGLAIPRNDVKSRNTAVVAVTCLLGPYVNPGDTLNIHVASLGDAKNLQGGVLIQTPLLAANGQVYA